MIKIPELFQIDGKPEFGNVKQIAVLKRHERVIKEGFIEMRYMYLPKKYTLFYDRLVIEDFNVLGVGCIDEEGVCYETGDHEFSKKWPKVQDSYGTLIFSRSTVDEKKNIVIQRKDILYRNIDFPGDTKCPHCGERIIKEEN